MEIDSKAENRFGRIGVLMGGPSTEREISLRSGKAVCDALKGSGLEAVAIDLKTDNKEEVVSLIKSNNLDCVFLALHGSFGEDGQIQDILETLKMPYTGSGVKASKLAMDKIASRRIFEAAGLNVPRYKVLDKGYRNEDLRSCDNLGLPLVVKPAGQGSSIGLSIIHKEEGLKKALDLAFSVDTKAIIEEYITGREMTVGILDGRPLPVIEIIPRNPFFDYEAKYQSGSTAYIVPARIEEGIAEKIKAAALSAHKLLGCFGCSRVDIILNNAGLAVVLEVNSIPGLCATSLLPKAAKSAGIEFNELCVKLIKLAYEKTPVASTD
ncbi:MAG: D-alanine--D-alanine ligase [Candidatus Omnitrophota bacterium]